FLAPDVHFETGQSSATFSVFLSGGGPPFDWQDRIDRPVDDTIELGLRSPVSPFGGPVGLGTQASAVLTIVDNDAPNAPLTLAQRLARQLFGDLLGRFPEAATLTL